MVTYTPTTPLESAIMESGSFELTTDSAGRDVLVIGPPSLRRVVVPRQIPGVAGLLDTLGSGGSRVFRTRRADPWEIVEEPAVSGEVLAAAEEYLVMGIHQLRAEGRPVRVAAAGTVVRLFLLPWTISARTVDFSGKRHFMVTNTRSVVGDWTVSADDRRGVVVGLAEAWLGLVERYRQAASPLALRCDVPVPWMGDTGLQGAVPTSVAAFDAAGADPREPRSGPPAETWVAKLPVVLTEGTVVDPVTVPEGLEVDPTPDGPWELEWADSADFSMGSLT